jgi:copper homeostasis protein
VPARDAVEICVGDLESAIAAAEGGADRVELCAHLAAGGITPSAGTIAEACRRLSIPVHVLIRPHEGGFVYSETELAVMRHDIEFAKAAGATGVVVGVLTTVATIDCVRTAELVALARPMSVTFHKAFDQTPELEESLDLLIKLGVDRVLTSGGRPTALDGSHELAGLVLRAAGRIKVMAGGRLAIDHLGSVVRQTGVQEVHLGSAAMLGDGAQPFFNRTRRERVAAIIAAVRG